MIILAEGGSELAAIRTLRLGAADYLPKRLLTPPRLQRSIKLTLRAIEKEAQRRAERLAQAGGRRKPDRRCRADAPVPRRRRRPRCRRTPVPPRTGARLAHRRAARDAATPVPRRRRAAARRRAHVATHTGAEPARAPRAPALAPAPTPAAAAGQAPVRAARPIPASASAAAR